jgi:hypothetical protein
MKSLLRCLFFLSLCFGASVAADAQTCRWDGATVMPGSWLESNTGVYRFCQCQSDGRWGNCTNTRPAASCDWMNPDWNDPACSGGGFKPCDWSAPDPANPSCDTSHSGGSGSTDPSCTTCHFNESPVPGQIKDPGSNLSGVYAAGLKMYERSCAKCHNPIESSTRKGRTASQIEGSAELHFSRFPPNRTWAMDWKARAIERVLSSEPAP